MQAGFSKCGLQTEEYVHLKIVRNAEIWGLLNQNLHFNQIPKVKYKCRTPLYFLLEQHSWPTNESRKGIRKCFEMENKGTTQKIYSSIPNFLELQTPLSQLMT